MAATGKSKAIGLQLDRCTLSTVATRTDVGRCHRQVHFRSILRDHASRTRRRYVVDAPKLARRGGVSNGRSAGLP